VTLGGFSRALRDAAVLDNRPIETPGAVVVLPYGVELLERFRAVVRAAYRDAGLDEYEYPSLAPADVLQPTSALLDLRDKVLRVGSDSDLERGALPYVLLPTGESAIYTHWARSVRSPADLPLRMYRRARYFRPVARGRHSGRGVFHALEHDDIFEFHCAHRDEAAQRADLERCQAMLAALLRACHVPALWTTRPPWTNVGEVADWTVAADTPLPVGGTAQLAAVYNQGTRFSRPYGIAYRQDGRTQHTVQLAGYVSRRLLMAHLLLGLRGDGTFHLHPDVAPVQVLILDRAGAASPGGAVAAVASTMATDGVRVRVLSGGADDVRRWSRTWRQRGVPLTITILPPREDGDPYKTVLRRSDTGTEVVIRTDTLAALPQQSRELLHDIGAAYAWNASSFTSERLVRIGRGELGEALGARLVAVIPLTASEEAVRAVETGTHGEVLGFSRAEAAAPCHVTGAPVSTVAFVSARL
jgi:hypothetical protein